MKKAFLISALLINVLCNTYSLSKHELIYRSEPYICEIYFQSSYTTFKIIYTCLITRDNNVGSFMFVTNPKIVSDQDDVIAEYDYLNKAFEYLINIDYIIPLDASSDKKCLISILTDNKKLITQINKMGEGLDDSSSDFLQYFIFLFLEFSMNNTVLPDMDEEIEVPDNHYLLTSTKENMTTQTTIGDLRYIDKRELILNNVKDIKISIVMRRNENV